MNELTQKDLAKKLKISQKTISRVINNDPLVKDGTRELVMREIQKSGYSLNKYARSLVQGKKGIIGVIIPAIKAMQSIYFLPTLEGILDEVKTYDKETFIISLDEDSILNKTFEVPVHEIDSLILFNMGIRAETKAALVEYLEGTGKNYIKIQGSIDGSDNKYVSVNNHSGAYNATEYLLSLGHRKIACLSVSSESNEHRERLRGYRDALKKHSLSPDDKLISAIHDGDCSEFVERMLKMKEKPDAVFALNDYIARMLIFELEKRKLSVPEDFSVIGFNDFLPYVEMSHPHLTTVKQPFALLGREAVKRIVDAGRYKSSRTLIKPEIVIRESCRKI